ncbi:MAG: hypothetical protein ACIPMY_04445 [Rickettsia endosymbiont of Pentastiridius leporinus]
MVVFLDTVVKPRYDTKRAFRSTQQCLRGDDIEQNCPVLWFYKDDVANFSNLASIL